jgi:hypothetical protein
MIGNANGETGTLERNVASLHISKDPTIKVSLPVYIGPRCLLLW